MAVCLLAAPLSLVILNTAVARPGQIPEGWMLKVNRGMPAVATVEDSSGLALRLRSRKSSFGLERPVDVDPIQLPYLVWRWKVTELPAGGDFRRASADDQAAQVLVAFTDRRIVTYIWDTTAPQGTLQSASSIPLVHIWAKVCQSGGLSLNRWVSEAHNVADDYRSAYGRPAPRVKGIRLQINSQHTGTSAESYFGEIAFVNRPQ